MGRIKLITLLVVITAVAACGPEQNHKQIARAPAGSLAPKPLPLPSPRQLPSAEATPGSSATNDADLLIAEAESQYQAGMADYRLGNLETAKEKFDEAVATLLQSGYDLSADDKLSGELHKLIENINSVELTAAERGDILAERKYEAPPIESLAGMTFPVDPRVKERVQREVRSVQSDLPLVSNDYVAGVITYLQNHARHYVQTVIERRGIYGPMISEALKKEGVPQDLIYLAAGESAFNPLALSRKGALGMWQFMLGTAAIYGLRKDAWVDEREDPFKSTVAAARHLKDLYHTFGDWYLAMAAYDAGPLSVQHAIEKTGYADYWTLRKLHAFPQQETENYVPIFLAVAIVAKDPKAYGFDVAPGAPLQVDRVTVTEPTDLRLISQLIDRPVDDLVQLNPQLQRWTTPANDPDFVLNLPAGTKDKLGQAIAAIPADKRIWWRAHKVESGETLSDIARKYRISPVALAHANQLSGNNNLEQGSHLLLPLAAGRLGSLQRVHERTVRRVYNYRVRQGDTLELVADRFDVTPYQIRRWNGMRSSRLVSGKTLRIYVSVAMPRTARTGRRKSYGKSRQYLARKRTPARHAGNTARPAAVVRSRSVGAG